MPDTTEYGNSNPKVEDLLRVYAEENSAGVRRARQAASALRKIEKIAGTNILSRSAGEVAANLGALLSEFDGIDSPRSSVRAWRSQIGAFFRWATDNGYLQVDIGGASDLGFPSVDEFVGFKKESKARTCYRLFLRDVLRAGIRAENVDGHWMYAFFRGLEERIADPRQCWKRFCLCWRRLAGAGCLPDIKLPSFSSKRPHGIAIPLEELPSRLRREVKSVRNRLLGKSLRHRKGRKPVAGSTADLRMGHLHRLIGFVQLKGTDLADISLREILTVANVIEFVESRESLYRKGEDDSVSQYIPSLLTDLEMLVRDGLNDHKLGDELKAHRRRYELKAKKLREEKKDAGDLDDYFRVACALLEKRRSMPEEPSTSGSRALLLRDALIFGLLAQFAYRAGLLAKIELGRHLIRSEHGIWIVSFEKSETKPKLRNSSHELPPELGALLESYLRESRPLLLGQAGHAFLFVAQGGNPLSPGSIYRVFRDRSFEVLGRRLNPHLTRKAWSQAFGEWASFDFVTSSAILDNSPTVQQASYMELRSERRLRAFDSNNERAAGA